VSVRERPITAARAIVALATLGIAGCIALGMAGPPASAQTPPAAPAPVASTTVPAKQTFPAFIEGLWPDAAAAKVSRATFDKALRGVEPDLSLPDLILPGKDLNASKGQAEFTRPPQDYLDRPFLERLAAQGRALATQHAAAVAKVEEKLGVDRTIVLAIWGRETAFGTHRLPHSAIRVLATQAWTGRRREMFRTELIFALRMLQDGLGTAETMRASWAGAMGLTQFMPSEFYGSGYDLDGDGRIDLFKSVPDALGSAAQQLKQKGWTAGLPWGFEVRPGPAVDCANEGPANTRTLGAWAARGVVRADGKPFPSKLQDAQAYLMSPGGTYGPQFLVTDNFKVLRAYNTSDLYALFVGHLADRIGGGADFRTGWSQIRQLPTRDIEEIQTRLKTQGYSIDKIDGKIGSNTRWQIGLYQRSRKIAVDCWPTGTLLQSLRQVATR
jgi:lytic murein transglycosylase